MESIVICELYLLSVLAQVPSPEFLKRTDTRTYVHAIFFRICAKFKFLLRKLAKTGTIHIFGTVLKSFFKSNMFL